MTDSITIDHCTLHLTGAELSVIVKYLHEGPFKEVSAVVHKIEEQVLAQWRAKQQPPPEAYPTRPPTTPDETAPAKRAIIGNFDEPIPQQ